MNHSKILLWSDGSKIFPVIHQVLTDAGCQVTTTLTRQGAVQALRTGGVRLLIARMSKNQPEFPAALRAIRRLNAPAATILLKGEHEVNSPIEAYQVDGQEEIFIPCGWAGLRRLVANCLSG